MAADRPLFEPAARLGNWRLANRQHRAIRDALAAGDGPAAYAALRADIDEAAAILAGLLA